MDIHTNIPLKNYTTMRLGGAARFMTDVHSVDELHSIYEKAKQQSLPVFILGGGSNTIVSDAGFDGIVVRNRIMGFEVLEDTAQFSILQVGAGENWDDIVARSVSMNLSGIEALSAIPGTCGAAPVQNIGAYGQEIADSLVSLHAYDTVSGKSVTLDNDACKFSYRQSIFRGDEKGKYVITSIQLKLYKIAPTPPFYATLQDYFDTHGITLYTPQTVRDAVIAIRQEKLPNPSEQPNAGSFFKNAIIDKWQFEELQKVWPTMPFYKMPEGKIKIPTGWLIEQTGYKGKTLHGIRVHDKNALVLINEAAKNYDDLAMARNEIKGAVRDQFRITIEQEPLEI